jgi:hypothetical protein
MFKISKLLSSSVIAAAAFCGPANCEELAADAGRTIALDDFRGTVYFSVNGSDYLVVATLDNDGRPVRFVTTLKPGQTTKISTPGAADQPEQAVEFKREGDHFIVIDHPRANPTDALVSDRRASAGR